MKNIKTITIGDLHGLDCWKNFADIKQLLSGSSTTPKYNFYIFEGDYVDSFTMLNDDIRENLMELIRFKTLYPDNVILLWGNHDVEYWKNLPWLKKEIFMTGFRPEVHYELYEIFNMNVRLFQLAFQVENYLWTHAGVHAGWYNHVFIKAIKETGINIDNMTVAEELNEAFLHRLPCIFHNDFRRGGLNKVGGPLWCSKELSYKKPLKNYHQIVGHTATKDIQIFKINDNTSITFCDILGTTQEALEIIL